MTRRPPGSSPRSRTRYSRAGEAPRTRGRGDPRCPGARRRRRTWGFVSLLSCGMRPRPSLADEGSQCRRWHVKRCRNASRRPDDGSLMALTCSMIGPFPPESGRSWVSPSGAKVLGSATNHAHPWGGFAGHLSVVSGFGFRAPGDPLFGLCSATSFGLARAGHTPRVCGTGQRAARRRTPSSAHDGATRRARAARGRCRRLRRCPHR